MDQSISGRGLRRVSESLEEDENQVLVCRKVLMVCCELRPALFYSFSFAPNPAWTSLHPAGPEMIRYFEDVCTKYGLNEKIQVNTEVSEARWLKDEEQWEITLMYLRPGMGDASEAQRREAIEKHGRDYVYLGIEKARAKVLVSAVGGLVEPKEWPKAIPGEETFAGDIFHSARWNREADLNDRDVVVVGTGCSAAQLVPVLRQPPYNARSVTQVMRSPPWVMPDVDLPVTRENWEKWSPKVFASVPGLARFFRTLLFLRLEYDWRLFGNSEFSARERTKVGVPPNSLRRETARGADLTDECSSRSKRSSLCSKRCLRSTTRSSRPPTL